MLRDLVYLGSEAEVGFGDGDLGEGALHCLRRERGERLARGEELEEELEEEVDALDLRARDERAFVYARRSLRGGRRSEEVYSDGSYSDSESESESSLLSPLESSSELFCELAGVEGLAARSEVEALGDGVSEEILRDWLYSSIQDGTGEGVSWTSSSEEGRSRTSVSGVR